MSAILGLLEKYKKNYRRFPCSLVMGSHAAQLITSEFEGIEVGELGLEVYVNAFNSVEPSSTILVFAGSAVVAYLDMETGEEKEWSVWNSMEGNGYLEPI